MKNNKLLGLLTGLLCISLCLALMLTACRIEKDDPEDQNPTVGEELSDPKQGKPSADEPTQPEQTQPEQTQPEVTEPEETQPEETQPSGGSSAPSVNTGTGGGYDPGASQPTEPEDATEPEIVVPEPGSEKNAYAEYIAESGSFTTVKIPAGQGMYYRLKTPGSFLRVEDSDAAVIVGETTYEAVDGVVEIALPADGSQAVSLVFVNQNAEDKAFGVEVLGVLGAQSNPIEIDSIADIQAALEEGDSDGIFYRWNADQSGILKLASDTAEVVVTVNGETAKLSESDGSIQLPVSEGDEVVIQVLAYANEDGTYPAIQAQVSGYVAVIVELAVSQVPSQVESVTVPAKQSVYYRITGTGAMSTKITDSDFSVICGGTLYSPNEQGEIQVDMPAGTGVTELELLNLSSTMKETQLYFNYAVGHKLNPCRLIVLDQLAVHIPEGQDGYYYSYTAPGAGMVTFQIWTYPEIENVKTDIVIVNETTGKTAALWSQDEDGEAVENPTASVPVNAGDMLTICASVTDIFGYSVYTDMEIFGGLYGSEEMPIPVMYPGFTACVPAGETLYYEGYNLGGLILSMSGSDVAISHNEVTYTPAGGVVSFSVVAEGRNPARFAITNTGSGLAEYDVVLAYPAGHVENPAALVLGVNTLTQTAGATDYYYTFTAPRAGAVTFNFDGDAQWVYAVDNVTQGIYGDTQWSDSDPMQPEITVGVEAGDQIVIRVNTYDAANMFENPAGTVVFEARYQSATTAIETVPGTTEAALISGEYAEFTGSFYGYQLVISDAQNAVVYYDGTAYYADASGNLNVEFPDAGTEDLAYTVFNAGSEELTVSMQLCSKNKGTADNPDAMVEGTNVMTQKEDNGPDYYYSYTVKKAGQFKLTINSTTGWIYELSNTTQDKTSGAQLSIGGKKTYTLNVKEGDVIVLWINTFDRRTGKSPAGTVEFTIDVP